jgi:hypothetical protein
MRLRPGLRSSEGRNRRDQTPGASPLFANSAHRVLAGRRRLAANAWLRWTARNVFEPAARRRVSGGCFHPRPATKLALDAENRLPLRVPPDSKRQCRTDDPAGDKGATGRPP